MSSFRAVTFSFGTRRKQGATSCLIEHVQRLQTAHTSKEQNNSRFFVLCAPFQCGTRWRDIVHRRIRLAMFGRPNDPVVSSFFVVVFVQALAQPTAPSDAISPVRAKLFPRCIPRDDCVRLLCIVHVNGHALVDVWRLVCVYVNRFVESDVHHCALWCVRDDGSFSVRRSVCFPELVRRVERRHFPGVREVGVVRNESSTEVLRRVQIGEQSVHEFRCG
mmetsp:Transcript_11679/g.29508  ORF Transcript_11679/g.29508 Transcript_11679/m.29508 type:complete len:219 (-) Transcript_11679:394-1050(-)